MSTITVPCVACYWTRQRQADPHATIHENHDGSWQVCYSDGTVGPCVYGAGSPNPRMCLCGVMS